MPITYRLPPRSGVHVWAWFWEINEVRASGMSSPNPITFTEIDAWCRLSGIRLQAWELLAIRSMDRAFLAACAHEAKPESQNRPDLIPATNKSIADAFRRRMKAKT